VSPKLCPATLLIQEEVCRFNRAKSGCESVAPWPSSAGSGLSRTARSTTKSCTAPPASAGSRWGRANVRSFVQHAQQIEEQADYAHLDGATQFDTFLVLSTEGQPLLRCSQKRADFYLKKGFARPLTEGVLQFTDDTTERTLANLYLGKFSQFFWR